VVEAQMMALALHSRWMGVAVDVVHATGGAAANHAILQVMADVFNADVQRLEVANAAALGAALRALHADRLDAEAPLSWDEVVDGLDAPAPARVRPDPARHAIYRDLLTTYAAFEREEYARGRASAQ
jgi:sugar (pentulose or hexulose) kinase